jgi:hypothetical protein
MNRALATQSDGRLLAARSATSWADTSRLLGAQPAPHGTNTFGDGATDLVYFPLTPCRILDTRFGTGLWAGRLAAGSTTAVAHNQNLAAQGGTAAGCGVPTDPAAIVATVLVVSPTGGGDLRIYATGTAVPNASVINYTNVPGLNLANTTVIPTGQILGNDFYIQVDVSATHVVIDVAGYFWKPSALPTAGHAFANVSPGVPAFVTARTKGFASVSRPGTGIYCLTPSAGVDVSSSAWVASVDFGQSSATDALVFVRQSALSCTAGDVEIRTYTTPATPTLSNSVAFHVFIP